MKKSLFTFLLLCLLIFPGLITAQAVTTSAFNGLVTDKDGNPIVGATVVAVHNADRDHLHHHNRQVTACFNIPAVRVGGTVHRHRQHANVQDPGTKGHLP